MQYISKWAMLGLLTLILVACGANDPTPAPNTGDMSAGEATQEPTAPAFVLVTRQPSEEVTPDILENYGATELIASATEDPERDLVFDRIQFARYGGRFPERLDITLSQDGTLTRNGATSTLSAAKVLEIDALLDSVNFFGIQNIMTSLAAESANTRYSLRVVRGGNDRTILSEDGFMPAEYMAVIAAFLTLGQ
jgi:hypothetical protein